MRPRWQNGLVLLLLAVCVWSVAHAAGRPGVVRLEQSMSAADFRRCGLHKLTTVELAALEDWLAAHRPALSDRTPSAAASAAGAGVSPETAARLAETVAFNVKSGKYHCLTCLWARQCTRNCVNIPLAAALARGAVPCKVCRGTCP